MVPRSRDPHDSASRFSQLVRGNPQERGSGIIDTRWFIESVQAAGLISNSKAWTAADQSALQQWFRDISPGCAPRLTVHMSEPRNNHGSGRCPDRGICNVRRDTARPQHRRQCAGAHRLADHASGHAADRAGTDAIDALQRIQHRSFHAWQKLAALSGSISGVIRRRKAAVFTRRSTMSPATSTVAKSGQARRSTASISRCF